MSFFVSFSGPTLKESPKRRGSGSLFTLTPWLEGRPEGGDSLRFCSETLSMIQGPTRAAAEGREQSWGISDCPEWGLLP